MTRKVTHLMPAPYKTSCFDYNKIGCKSRSDCITKCQIEWALKHSNSLPFWSDLDIHNDKDQFKTYCHDEEHCQQKFASPNCINEYFTLKPMGQTKLNKIINKKQFWS